MYECISVCKIALDHVNVCTSQQSQMIFDGFMCFFLCMSTQHVFTRTCMHVCPNNHMPPARQGKGHFRRTRMYTHACFVHHQSVCVCMCYTCECDAFKPRAKATINPKHTRHDTQDLFAPAIRREKPWHLHPHAQTHTPVHTCTHPHAYIHTLNSTTTY